MEDSVSFEKWRYNAYYITECKIMIPSLKEEDGSIITNRERILEGCADFYEKLYEDTVQNIAKVETEEVPSILTSEVERESLKPNKEDQSTRRRPDCSRNDKSRR